MTQRTKLHNALATYCGLSLFIKLADSKNNRKIQRFPINSFSFRNFLIESSSVIILSEYTLIFWST